MDYQLILASNSPRRRELLESLELQFTVKTIQGIDESYPDTLVGEQIPIHISRTKAQAYLPTLTDRQLIITADTIVYLPDERLVLGKPVDRDDACHMLRLLSGRTHQVITGVTLLTLQREHSFAATSRVTFSALTDEEINHYVDTYKPYDKAGAYGIQEWIGLVGVCGLEGSYFNVMGLPVQRLYQELKKF